MSVSILILIVALASISLSVNARRQLTTQESFSLWKSQYNKSYENSQIEEMRFTNFKLSLDRVHRLSSRRTIEGGAIFGLTMFSGSFCHFFHLPI